MASLSFPSEIAHHMYTCTLPIGIAKVMNTYFALLHDLSTRDYMTEGTLFVRSMDVSYLTALNYKLRGHKLVTNTISQESVVGSKIVKKNYVILGYSSDDSIVKDHIIWCEYLFPLDKLYDGATGGQKLASYGWLCSRLNRDIRSFSALLNGVYTLETNFANGQSRDEILRFYELKTGKKYMFPR